jgi:hypothetical protein
LLDVLLDTYNDLGAGNVPVIPALESDSGHHLLRCPTFTEPDPVFGIFCGVAMITSPMGSNEAD